MGGERVDEAAVNALIEHVNRAIRSMTAASQLVALASTFSADNEVNSLFLLLQAETVTYVDDAYPQTAQLMRNIARVVRFYLADDGYNFFLENRESVLAQYDTADGLAAAIVRTHQGVRRRLDGLKSQVMTVSNARKEDADQTRRQADQLLLQEQEYRRQVEEFNTNSRQAEAMAQHYEQQAYAAHQNHARAQIQERQANNDLTRTSGELETAKTNWENAQNEYNTASNNARYDQNEADNANDEANSDEHEANRLEERADEKKDLAKAAKFGSVLALGTALFDGGSHSAGWAAGAAALYAARSELQSQAASKRQRARSSRNTANAARARARNWTTAADGARSRAGYWKNQVDSLDTLQQNLTAAITAHREDTHKYELEVTEHDANLQYCKTQHERCNQKAEELAQQATTCRQQANQAHIDEGNKRAGLDRLNSAITELGRLVTGVNNVSVAVQGLSTFVRSIKGQLMDTKDEAATATRASMFGMMKREAGKIIDAYDRYRSLEEPMDRIKDFLITRGQTR